MHPKKKKKNNKNEKKKEFNKIILLFPTKGWDVGACLSNRTNFRDNNALSLWFSFLFHFKKKTNNLQFNFFKNKQTIPMQHDELSAALYPTKRTIVPKNQILLLV